MRILIEEHQYRVTEEMMKVVGDLVPTVSVGDKVSVGYVGYYYNSTIKDFVFVLPKVILDKDEKAFGNHDPEQIVHLESKDNPLHEDEQRFIYNLSVWIYRAISVFQERHKDSQIVLHQQMAQIGHGQRRLSNTFLDILLNLEQFHKDNQDFFFFVIKNQHSGNNKTNWTKTISHSQAFIQDGAPIYMNPVNKRKQVNFDEELMVIYFSILNHLHKEYGFPFDADCHYELIDGPQFQSYLNGMGRVRLREIRYKYFSDRTIELWELCDAFFERAKQVAVSTHQREHLLVKSFQIVFEDIIDELLGGRNDELPKELQEQADGKRVDHMFRYKSLVESGHDKTYYIGDSKYYKRNTDIGKEALYKQFTYARNVIQWNLNLFLDENKVQEQAEEVKNGTGMLRDPETEGYNIIPNFFISAQQRDLEKHSEITWVDRDETDFTSRQFPNRLFDRDTLLVCHYDVNFLYVVSLYGRKNEGMKATWRDEVKEQFRREIQTMLDNHYQFHVMTPREHMDGQQVLQEHFKEVLGKVFRPYPDSVNGQEFYSLALQKPNDKMSEKERRDLEIQNARVKELLEPYFEILECSLGEDKRDKLQTPAPDGVIYANETDLSLLIYSNHIEDDIKKLEDTGMAGIALKMDGASLQLVEGFTKAKYLIIHNKGDKYKAFQIIDNGPKLVSKSNIKPMLVTKKDEELYLVYKVNTEQEVFVGELDLSIIAKKGPESYSPWLLPLDSLRSNKDVR